MAAARTSLAAAAAGGGPSQIERCRLDYQRAGMKSLSGPRKGKFTSVPWEDGVSRWLTDDEQETWRATLTLHKLLVRQLDRDLHADGFSGHDYEILVALSEAPERRMRMTDLADATSQSRSRLSHQITRMQARDLVRREECEGDKRGTWAVLTEFGMATIERIAPRHVDCVRRHFIDRLTPRQQEEIRAAYEPVIEYLRKIRDRD